MKMKRMILILIFFSFSLECFAQDLYGPSFIEPREGQSYIDWYVEMIEYFANLKSFAKVFTENVALDMPEDQRVVIMAGLELLEIWYFEFLEDMRKVYYEKDPNKSR